MTQKEYFTYLLLICLIFMCFIFIKTAWVSDDSYITFRTVDNFVKGYGLRWNTDERVQANTHPLWMFLVTCFYFFTGEFYFTVIILSLFLSLFSAWLIGRKCCSDLFSLLMVFTILISSKAFVDFSSSGLENPLSYFLMTLFCILFLTKPFNRKNFFLLSLTASFAMFNRLDSVLFYIAPLIYTIFILWRREGNRLMSLIKTVMIAFLPLLAWFLFSLVYYGFVFPNTFYAKLNTGIPHRKIVYQGFIYFIDSIGFDSITLLVIVFSILLAFLTKEGKKISMTIGILLYLVYILNIGGCFMSGRFFSLPLLAAVILLTQIEFKKPLSIMLPVVFLLIGLAVRNPTTSYNIRDAVRMKCLTGVIDERSFYYPHTGLLTRSRNRPIIGHHAAADGKALCTKEQKVYRRTMIGFFGFYAGPEIHIIDNVALADPLLSHLPAIQKKWRVGHYTRHIPDGYMETISTGKNRIKNKKVRRLYRIIKEITQGKIFSLERFKLIIKFNLGHYGFFTK